MSRAFVKEMDEQAENPPERPQSPHTNYVTPQGFAALEAQVRELSAQRDTLAGREDLDSQQQIKNVERDLHYYAERVKRAVLVRPETQPHDKVHFGAAVEVEDEAGERSRFVIVGEDEADAAQGKISWVSPLARALLNAGVGDVVTWHRPVGDKPLEIIAIGQP
jgi:transcription elongation GreA/GreB family factor